MQLLRDSSVAAMEMIFFFVKESSITGTSAAINTLAPTLLDFFET